MKYEIIIYDNALDTQSEHPYPNKDLLKILNSFTLPSRCTILVKYKGNVIDNYTIEYCRTGGMIESVPFIGYVSVNYNRIVGRFIYNIWDNKSQKYIFRKMKRIENNIMYI